MQVQNPELVDNLRAYFAPNSVLELWEWLTCYHYGGITGITDHFRGAALLANWNWAGAPFVVPGSIVVQDSILRVGNIAAASQSFLYQAAPAITINNIDKYASVGLNAQTVGFGGGLRMDDGTNNNFIEVVLLVNQFSPTLWEIRARGALGGVPAGPAISDTLNLPISYLLRMDIFGTIWTAWSVYPELHHPFGHLGRMWKPAIDVFAAGGNFTPTRVGLIFDNSPTAGTWERVYVDWCTLE